MNDRKRLILNVDPDLHAQVAKLARQDLRSMNAEAVTLLREAIQRRQELGLIQRGTEQAANLPPGRSR